MKNVLKVAAIQCPKCLDIVFSRHHYDFRFCSCKQVGIDGGREYTRVTYNAAGVYCLTLDLIGLTEKDLSRDSSEKPKYGLIKTTKIAYDMLYRYTYNAAGKFYRYEKNPVKK